MKKAWLIFVLSFLPNLVFAIPNSESFLYGKWLTTSERCEKSGPYAEDFQEQTKLVKWIEFSPHGQMKGDFRSLDESYHLTFRGTFHVRAHELTVVTTESTENGVKQNDFSSVTSNYSLNGNSLTISHAITDSGEACPIGDHAVTVMRRLSK